MTHLSSLDTKTELAVPHVFNQMPYDEFIRQNQASTNQLLSGFSTHEVHLRKDETYTFYTLLGSYSNLDSLNESARHWDFSYFESLEALSESLLKNSLLLWIHRRIILCLINI